MIPRRRDGPLHIGRVRVFGRAGNFDRSYFREPPSSWRIDKEDDADCPRSLRESYSRPAERIFRGSVTRAALASSYARRSLAAEFRRFDRVEKRSGNESDGASMTSPGAGQSLMAGKLNDPSVALSFAVARQQTAPPGREELLLITLQTARVSLETRCASQASFGGDFVLSSSQRRDPCEPRAGPAYRSIRQDGGFMRKMDRGVDGKNPAGFAFHSRGALIICPRQWTCLSRASPHFGGRGVSR